jgi:fatty-acyl-CoA synthase
MSQSPVSDLVGTIRSQADLERVEATAWRQHIPATDTYHLLRDACLRHGERTALRLLLAGTANAPTRDISRRLLLENVHRTANALHELGVDADVPVAILLPGRACATESAALW